MPLREITLLILAFLASLVSIMGDTRKTGTGSRTELTTVGKVAVCLAAATLALAAWGVIARNSELSALREAEESVRQDAYVQLRGALDLLGEPLRMLGEDDARRVETVFPEGSFTAQLDWLRAVSEASTLDDPVLNSPVRVNTWRTCFAQVAREVHEELESAVRKYVDYLPPDVVSLVEELRRSDFLTEAAEAERRRSYSRGGPGTVLGHLREWRIDEVGPPIDALWQHLREQTPVAPADEGRVRWQRRRVCVYPAL